MERIEKRRPTVEELRAAPLIIRKLEVAQLSVDASGTPIEEAALALLEGPESDITPEAIDALRQQLARIVEAVPA